MKNSGKKRVVITGGAGFIGSAVIHEFLRQGHEIFVIDNLSFGNREFISVPDSHFFCIDIRDAAKVQQTIQSVNPDWLIHLAAIHFIPYCNQHPVEASEINIIGTINVLDAAATCSNLRKILFASTAAVYPVSAGAMNETVATGPMDIYGITKLAGERLTHEFFLKSGIESVVCRFFNAFGPNETNAHLIPEIQKQILNGTRTIHLGNLTPKRDFIHTYDMAKAVHALMQTPIKGFDIFNLGRGEEYSVIEIVNSFERALNEKINIEIDPARVRAVERMHLLADITRLKQTTGWFPEWTIDQGIQTLVKQNDVAKN